MVIDNSLYKIQFETKVFVSNAFCFSYLLHSKFYYNETKTEQQQTNERKKLRLVFMTKAFVIVSSGKEESACVCVNQRASFIISFHGCQLDSFAI